MRADKEAFFFPDFYDTRMQLRMFQIKMLHDRFDDRRIVPTPEERAKLLRLGNESNRDVADIMPAVKPQTNAFCESFIGTCKHQCLNHKDS